MTTNEINQMLKSVGIPYAYYQFNEETIKAENITPPFMVFYYDRSDDFYADDTNYQNIAVLIIELYSDAKDFVLERTLERLINENGLTYTKTETFIEDERLFMEVYEMEVLLNG